MKIDSDRASFPILFVKPQLQGGHAKEWVSILMKTFAVQNLSPRNDCRQRATFIVGIGIHTTKISHAS